jgi:pSer/pThr/pTyr-binding forkhead associated (FHA) protein
VVSCSRCGHANAPEDRFCARCGTALHDDTAAIPSLEVEEPGEGFPFPGEQLRPGQALVAVRSGADAGSTFLIDRDLTAVGRDPGSDVFLDDVTVSRKHAEIRRQPDGFFVHDLGSLNGTYVNRERVDLTKLANGDEIQVGRYRLAFFVAEA